MFVSTPVPQVVEELAEASRVFSQDKVQQRFGKQTIETPAIPLEKIVQMPVTRTYGKTQQVENTHVQHVVNTIKVEKFRNHQGNSAWRETRHPGENQPDDQAHRCSSRGAKRGASHSECMKTEVPQVQHIDRIMDLPAGKRHQEPTIQTEQKTAEVPDAQNLHQVKDMHVETQQQLSTLLIDTAVDVPLMAQRQVNSIQRVQKTVEVRCLKFSSLTSLPMHW